MKTLHVREGDQLKFVYGSRVATLYIRVLEKTSARLTLEGKGFVLQAISLANSVKIVEGRKVSSPVKESETWLSKERYGYPSAVKLVHVATGTTVVITCTGCQNKTMSLELVFPDKIIQVDHQKGDSWTADELIIRSIREEMVRLIHQSKTPTV